MCLSGTPLIKLFSSATLPWEIGLSTGLTALWPEGDTDFMF
jgi:hypothetical protein